MIWHRAPQELPPEAHRCDLPNQELRWSIVGRPEWVACSSGTTGAVIECDECGQPWEAVWEAGAAWWQPITKRRLRKLLRETH